MVKYSALGNFAPRRPSSTTNHFLICLHRIKQFAWPSQQLTLSLYPSQMLKTDDLTFYISKSLQHIQCVWCEMLPLWIHFTHKDNNVLKKRQTC